MARPQQRKRFRLDGSPAQFTHGASGYGNYGCRCPVCTSEHAAWYGIRNAARARRLGPCVIDGCDGYQYAKGMCHAHYERARVGKTPLNARMRRRPNSQIYNVTGGGDDMPQTV